MNISNQQSVTNNCKLLCYSLLTGISSASLTLTAANLPILRENLPRVDNAFKIAEDPYGSPSGDILAAIIVGAGIGVTSFILGKSVQATRKCMNDWREANQNRAHYVALIEITTTPFSMAAIAPSAPPIDEEALEDDNYTREMII